MKTLAALLSSLLLASCAALGGPPVRDYTLCFLLTDRPVEELEEGALRTAMAGHFENMGRLADEGLLLMAGPLGEPRSDPLHRGIFLFDIADPSAAEALAATDPAVKAGVFTTRVHPLRSAAPFGDLPRLEEQALRRRRAEDSEAEEWIGRMYVLASCPDGDAAEEALDRLRDATVLFAARLGGELEGTGLFALDVEDPAEARRLVDLAGPGLDWSLHPWYGTERLEEFALLP